MNIKEIVEQTDPDVKYTAFLLISENGVGSILHAIKLPLAGHLLSINQIGIIHRATSLTNDKGIALRVSLGSSLLKSLSPAGKKLTPMLAILAQGFLYSLPIYLFGINILSSIVGIFLSSLWAFIQPILFLYIFFGNDLYKDMEKILKEIKPFIPNIDQYAVGIIVSLILLKFLLAIIYARAVVKNENIVLKHINNEKFTISSNKNLSKTKNPFILAFFDLLNPLFIFSFFLTFLYFYFMESDHVQLIWNCTRPIAIGFITFYFIRIFPMNYLTNFLLKYGFSKIAETVKKLKEWTLSSNQ